MACRARGGTIPRGVHLFDPPCKSTGFSHTAVFVYPTGSSRREGVRDGDGAVRRLGRGPLVHSLTLDFHASAEVLELGWQLVEQEALDAGRGVGEDDVRRDD